MGRFGGPGGRARGLLGWLAGSGVVGRSVGSCRTREDDGGARGGCWVECGEGMAIGMYHFGNLLLEEGQLLLLLLQVLQPRCTGFFRGLQVCDDGPAADLLLL